MSDSESQTTTPTVAPTVAPPPGKSSATPTHQRASAKPQVNKKTRSRRLPPYHVVLMDDDDHSYEYVIEMLRSLFGHVEREGFRLAKEVDRDGRAVVFTTHKELAELKRDQIHCFGKDLRVATCAGAMSALIEPAKSGD